MKWKIVASFEAEGALNCVDVFCEMRVVGWWLVKRAFGCSLFQWKERQEHPDVDEKTVRRDKMQPALWKDKMQHRTTPAPGCRRETLEEKLFYIEEKLFYIPIPGWGVARFPFGL